MCDAGDSDDDDEDDDDGDDADDDDDDDDRSCPRFWHGCGNVIRGFVPITALLVTWRTAGNFVSNLRKRVA